MPELERLVQQLVAARLCSASSCLLATPRGRGIPQLLHVAAAGHTRAAMPAARATKDTLFDLGGLTSTLATANLAMMLVGQGRLDLQRPLGTMLGEAAGGPLADVPLAALLDHTSGLPSGEAELEAAAAAAPAPARAHVGHAREMQARVTARVSRGVDGFVPAAPPLDAAGLQALRARLARTRPIAAVSTVARHSALGSLLLGWALESACGMPLDVAVQKLVVGPIVPAGAMQFVRNGPQGPLDPAGPAGALHARAAMTLACPWRHRPMVGEAADKVAWLLGGVAGHSGLLASGDGVMRLLLGLYMSLQGLVRYAHPGTLARFWARSQRVSPTSFTLGWQLPSRDNGMVPSRWPGRSVGQIAASGCSVFVDPGTGTLGVLLSNLGHPDAAPSDAQRADFARARGRIFDAMAAAAAAAAPAGPARPRR